MGVDVALGEVVVRAALQCLPDHLLIRQAAQHKDEHIWHSPAHLIHCLDALNVGQ